MKKEEYIKKCGCNSAKELTEEQLFLYFSKYDNTRNCRFDVKMVKVLVESGVVSREEYKTKMMQAFVEDKKFVYHPTMYESGSKLRIDVE